jgi:hypothetical protein
MKDLPKRPAAFVLSSTHHGSMLVNRHDYDRTPQANPGIA